jgi:hypothetical protein
VHDDRIFAGLPARATAAPDTYTMHVWVAEETVGESSFGVADGREATPTPEVHGDPAAENHHRPSATPCGASESRSGH